MCLRVEKLQHNHFALAKKKTKNTRLIYSQDKRNITHLKTNTRQ